MKLCDPEHIVRAALSRQATRTPLLVRETEEEERCHESGPAPEVCG